MNFRSFCVLGALAVALSAQAFGLSGGREQGAEPFVFAEKGVSRAAIVVRKDAGPGYRHAAKELADYLGKITGGGFAVSERPVKGYNTILLGTPYSTTNRDEICIRVKDAATLEVTGDGPLGTTSKPSRRTPT